MKIRSTLRAVEVTAKDIRSWMLHGTAQENMGNRDSHEKGLEIFVRAKTPVEAAIFKLPRPVARLTAQWLGSASGLHDKAEEIEDQKGILAASEAWANVQQNLAIRYAVKNIWHAAKRESRENVFSILQNIQTTSEKEGKTPLEYLTSWLSVNNQLFTDSSSEIIKKSQVEAYYECHQWQTHHRKKYREFTEYSTTLFEVSHQLTHNVAKHAAERLAEACKWHDRAEHYSSLRKQAFNKLLKYSLFAQAIPPAVEHNRILLTKSL
ncbi:MAG: hypothetical protein WCP97_07060 [bacterium]